MARPKMRWVDVRARDHKVFKGRGKEVKKFDILKRMTSAAARKRG